MTKRPEIVTGFDEQTTGILELVTGSEETVTGSPPEPLTGSEDV